ncbi:hypothetical protein BDN72DRAFT_900686 [Pluteus cervinus]|uniref:Uncharacterized protein n=1 Tax=Pluteus cervinus TaxID=181527 RepID=A0ACD3AII5_9AGAR|nr:hypothetical protein BDN72DRAFT_900686 [Pluteus cervinus]
MPNPTASFPPNLPSSSKDSHQPVIIDLDELDVSTSPTEQIDPSFILSLVPILFGARDSVHTIEQWESLQHTDSAATIHAMGQTLKSLVRQIDVLRQSLDRHEEEMQAIKSQVECKICGIPCRDPYVLPCDHIFCGRCLERLWRPQLERRIRTTTLPNGMSAQQLIDGFEDTEIGFQKALRIMEQVEPGLVFVFTSYRSPCCHHLIDGPPNKIFSLTSFCNNGAVAGTLSDYTPPDRKYFFRLFPLPILKW